MKKCYSLTVLLFFLFILHAEHVSAQVFTTSNSNAMQLVQNLVGNGVIITSATLNCPANGSGTFSTAGACSSVGIPQGVVLTSGSVANVPGPNLTGSAGTMNGAGGYAPLDGLAGAGTEDACVLTFTFIPTTNVVNFNYLFGSEEYPEFVNGGYNDAFGFFITGPNPLGGNYTNYNIAQLPGGTPVTIDNVNAGTNSGYYVNNTGGACLQYDGYTTTLTASASVVPCSSYTFTIAIADAGDDSYDSGVFLQENSFNSGSFTATLVNQTNATCTTLGSATVSASGGNPPYTYSWNTTPVQNTATASGLSPGSYTCTVSYMMCGQSISTTVPVTITGTSTVTVGVTSQTNVSCNGGTNGAATVSASGGSGSYTYSWAPSGGSGTTATNLAAGTYTVTVNAGGGCTNTTTVNITQPPALTTTGTFTNVSCNGGANGSATVTPSGGSAYTYSWAPSGGTGATASNLGAGTYTVTVTSAGGCTVTRTFNITQPPALTTTGTSANVTCNGGTNGSATVTPSGGSGYTYSWAPSGGTGATASNLAAGNYTVTVTSTGGCTITRTYNITQPPAVTGTGSPTNVTCNGGTNGSATVVPSGGSGSGYTYNWTPSGGTGATASNLGAGTYTVTISDGNGCTGTRSFNITQPPAIATTMSSVNATCGSSNGQASVTASGGTGGYTYSWAPSGGTGSTATGLATGSYTVTVTDNSGCAGTGTVNVTNPSAPTATISAFTNVSCNGGNNGSATVTASGGSGGYSYNWAPSGGTGTTASNLTAGTYTVTVQDGAGCTNTATVNITQPPALSTTGTQTDVGCNGGTNGSATVTPSGGSGYTYSWAPSGGTGATASNLAAGTYTVTVTSTGGCTITRTYNITQPPVLTTTGSQNDVSCNGAGDGSATVTPSGGTGSGYTYSWTPSGGTASTASNLASGTYTVTVSDGNGCTATRTYNITQAPAIILSMSSVNSSCGLSNGQASVTASGGEGGFTYAWTPSGGSGSTATGLAAAIYTVTVTDVAGCTASSSVNVNNNASPTAMVTSSTNVSCFGGNNGSATVSVTGGGGSNIYSWAPSGGNAATANNLTAGSYTVTVTDVNGCTSMTGVNITEPPQLSITIPTVTHVTCFGANDGILGAQANGGAGGNTYAWTPSGGTAATANNLADDTYTVTVTDANNCTATASATITEPTQVTLSVASQSDITCFGYNDGAVSLTGSGGTGSLTYGWAPSGPGTSSSTTLGAATYTVTASDQNNCTASVTFTIDEPATVTLNMTVSEDTLCNGEQVQLGAITGGGTGNYTYFWNGTSGASSVSYTPGATTTYTVVVSDQNGCTRSATTTVHVGDIPSASFTATSVCEGQQTAFTNTSTIGSGTITSYLWDFDEGTAGSSIASPVHLYGGDGTYNVMLTVTSDFGCTNSVTVPVAVNAVPDVNFTADALTGCTPLCVNFTDLTQAPGAVIASWDWSANNQNFSSSQNPNHCFTIPGTYGITLTTTTAAGCTNTITIPNYIQVYPNTTADFTMSATQVSESSPNVIFTDASVNAGSWSWDFGDGATSSSQNPSHLYADTGYYCVTLTVTAAGGCTDSETHCLSVLPEIFIYIPNTFTPNSDDINDNFIVRGRGLVEGTLFIFDRWGETLTRLDKDQPFTTGWDGTYLGSPVKQDVYTYKLVVKDAKGDTHEYLGHVNVIY